MKMKLIFLCFVIVFANSVTAQTGWYIQPSFTSQNLYDCKQSAVYNIYIGSDNGKVFRSTNAGTWAAHNFNDPTLNNCSFKYVRGGNSDAWQVVGTGAGYGFNSGSIDSVYRITNGVQPTLEAFSLVSGWFFYEANIAAGAGGNFYVQDASNQWIWRKDNNATALANGRNINYSSGNLFVGDNGLVMLADSIGLPNGNEYIEWKIIPSGTGKNLNYVANGGNLGHLIVGDDGTILKSTNGGYNWTAIQCPTTEDLYGAWIGYAYLICGANGTILRCYTMDLNKWYRQVSPTSQDLYFILTLGYSEFISGGENGIFLRTDDGGGSLKRYYGTSLMEGFYNPVTNSLVGDTISVTVRNASSPYSIVETGKTKLSTSGYGLAELSPMVFHSVPYWIQINHRNSIETWSKTPLTFSTNSDLQYDFDIAATRAYGDNQKLVDTSPYPRFAFYGGDVNQDDVIDLTDIINIFNDANNFLTGYVVTDVTGDNFVDLSDLTLALNNANAFVGVVTP